MLRRFGPVSSVAVLPFPYACCFLPVFPPVLPNKCAFCSLCILWLSGNFLSVPFHCSPSVSPRLPPTASPLATHLKYTLQYFYFHDLMSPDGQEVFPPVPDAPVSHEIHQMHPAAAEEPRADPQGVDIVSGPLYAGEQGQKVGKAQFAPPGGQPVIQLAN